jgi:hypothetical protein
LSNRKGKDMASVVVNGDTSGAVTLSAPAVAGTVTVTLPSTSGTMAVLPTATGVLAESAGGTGTTTGYYGFKNRIINGAMVIDQRNAGASLAITTNSQYSVDRFNGNVFSSGTGRYSLQQSTTVPAGFTNSLQMTVTTADASPSADYGYALQQSIEGLNCTDLNWGSANASTVTLSFWVYSSVTGSLPIVLLNSGFARYYATTYSVPSANTWTQIKLTIVGDTSGTWLTTSGGGIYINFGFGAGSNRTASTANAWSTSAYGGNLTSVTGATSVIATNGATWFVTGVQLEKGSTATSFDFRSIGTELALCQRYYVKWNASDAFSYFATGVCYDNASAVVALSNPVQMRAQPTWGAPSNCRLYDGSASSLVTSISVNRSSVLVSSGNFTTGSTSFAATNPVVVSANNNSAAYLEVSAEL